MRDVRGSRCAVGSTKSVELEIEGVAREMQDAPPSVELGIEGVAREIQGVSVAWRGDEEAHSHAGDLCVRGPLESVPGVISCGWSSPIATSSPSPLPYHAIAISKASSPSTSRQRQRHSARLCRSAKVEVAQ